MFVAIARKLRSSPIAASLAPAGGIPAADLAVVAIVVARTICGSRNFPQEVELADVFHF